MSISPDDVAMLPNDHLKTLLQCDVPQYSYMSGGRMETPTAGNPTSGGTEGCDGRLRIIKVIPAGDIQHVFSHIKKTYRVQWVLLEGGDKPPELISEVGVAVAASNGTSVKGKALRRAKVKETGGPGDSKVMSLTAMWIAKAEVPKAK